MNVAVIGLGQAGSNIADEAGKLGFLSGAINFSQKDLNSVDVTHKLRLLGSEGVGKNREQAITLFQAQWKTAVDFIVDNFSNADVIIFAFSASGGSGSGISPILLDVMSNTLEEKTFAALVVLPEMTEATTSQINCLSTFSELSSLNIPVFPIDNQHVRMLNPTVGKNKLYEISNKESISLLNKLISYTDKCSKTGNFDKRDFITALNTAGIAIIAEVDIAAVGLNVHISPEGVGQRVKDSWSNTIFTPIDFSKVTRAAIIFDGQEALMEHVRYEHMFDNFKHGMPIDLFEGNYHEHNGKIISLLTGLSWCKKRLKDIEELINSNQDKVKSVLIEQVTYQPNKTVELLTQMRKAPEKKKPVMDILNKYIKK